eukprot:7641440-Karenia_brevis.AAC.1
MEVKSLVNAIPKDDEDRKFKIHHLKLDVVLRSRYNHDINQGVPEEEARKRHKLRLWHQMRQA